MIIKSMLSRFKRLNTKKLAVAGVFMLAMAGSIGLGLATKQLGSAATGRDCSVNSIDYKPLNGGCGALSPTEFIKDANQNDPGDLQAIYAHPTIGNLAKTDYTRFEQTARMGVVDDKGNVTVDGQVVMTGANSMGRKSFNNPARKPMKIGNQTYFYSSTDVSFAEGVTSLPVMVMFDDKGVVETAIMNACGNPVWGNNVVPEFGCEALNQTKISDDTFDFTTTVRALKGASVKKVVYDFGDGTTKEVSSATEVVRHKYASVSREYTAKVTVTFNLPGNKEVTVPPVKCATKVTVAIPFYLCQSLLPIALNDKKTQFRFTVMTSQGNGATLKDADFTLDGNSTVTGVTTKDANGNIYKDYTFAEDGKPHTVVAKVNFNLASGVQSKACQATVEAGKIPECKPGIPVGDPRCEEYKCPIPGKEHLPKEREHECVAPPVLPETGMGNILGLFAGTSAFGAVAHRVVAKRRARNS
jgi:hypothetical protein